ncbi:hypothetical protein [Streptomyces fradiae]|uniref:hypothetical protein n=1 Tax=Streptomyces fradiae TaxID=1906 RepID=UPI002941F097|nr:hypothetical protein [Streptomyces fradiae]WOI58634.1 hypothetical protein RYQ63_01040 [Streptomyces fradiae]
MTSTMEWIRRQYGVPARHKMRITYNGKPATIVGARGSHLRIRIDGERRILPTHPCYRIVYPQVPAPPRPRGWCRHCGKDRAMTKAGVMGQHRWHGRPCPGIGQPPTHRVVNQTHPGEQQTAARPVEETR